MHRPLRISDVHCDLHIVWGINGVPLPLLFIRMINFLVLAIVKCFWMFWGDGFLKSGCINHIEGRCGQNAHEGRSLLFLSYEAMVGLSGHGYYDLPLLLEPLVVVFWKSHTSKFSWSHGTPRSKLEHERSLFSFVCVRLIFRCFFSQL